MVGERGFEPPTPWSRTRCSTRLSHSPTCVGWLPTIVDFTEAAHMLQMRPHRCFALPNCFVFLHQSAIAWSAPMSTPLQIFCCIHNSPAPVPEWVVGAQAEGQPCAGAKVKASSGNVGLSKGWPMARKADCRPALRVECPRSVSHAPHYSSHCCPDLAGMHAFGEIASPRHFSQMMQRTEAIRQFEDSRYCFGASAGGTAPGKMSNGACRLFSASGFGRGLRGNI